MRKNLLFYCYARRAGQMWRRTVNHLLRRWPTFTGRKIVYIAWDRCCDEPETVQEAFAGRGCEFIIGDNVPGLQEVAGFLPLMERVESRDPDEFTFYCHAKGATHVDPNAASHKWCDAMASACLDYEPLVDSALQRANVCGAFQSHGLWSFRGYHNHHFAGTFFWMRHSRIFGSDLNWRDLEQNFMGVEAFPGIFPLDESACLFFRNANTAHLYDNEFWKTNITPALRWWRHSLEECLSRAASQSGGDASVEKLKAESCRSNSIPFSSATI